MDSDYEARSAPALIRAGINAALMQGQPGRDEARWCGHAEKRHLDTAVVALIHQQAHAAPLSQLALHAACCLAHFEEAAAERRPQSRISNSIAGLLGCR